MTRAAIYLRISRDKEGRELGVERQEQQCRALAERLGYSIAAVFKDNDKGASRHSRKTRPDYARMLKAAKEGQFDVILAATSSRLTRQPREFEDLLDLFDTAGTTFEYVKTPRFDLGTAAGRKMARYAAADGAEESDEISERVRDTLDQRRAAGKPHGGKRPYGWETDRLTIRESEAQWIRWGVTQTLAGVPLRSQFRELNAKDVRAAAGGIWTHGSWRGVLVSARHAGLMVDGQSRAAWPEIITPEQHRAVLRILNDPARVTTPGRGGKLHLLSGIARCGVPECGGPVRVGKSKGGVFVYRCPTGHVSRAKEPIEYVVRQAVAKMLREKVADLLAGTKRQDGAEARKVAENEAARLRLLIDQAAAEHGQLGLPLSALAAYTAPLREQLAAAELAAEPPQDRKAVLGDVLAADDPGDAFLALEVDRQRPIVEMLLDIRIGRAARGNRFRMDGIEIGWR